MAFPPFHLNSLSTKKYSCNKIIKVDAWSRQLKNVKLTVESRYRFAKKHASTRILIGVNLFAAAILSAVVHGVCLSRGRVSTLPVEKGKVARTIVTDEMGSPRRGISRNDFPIDCCIYVIIDGILVYYDTVWPHKVPSWFIEQRATRNPIVITSGSPRPSKER